MNMDSISTSSAKVDQKITNRFASVLTYAACEWFLIFIMFIDALLFYLLVWFASYCRLQLPCFFCSKLHHRFQWRSFLCSSHISEVSSLISCQIHDNNLVDCHGMCDDCLLSFTKKKTPNPDMHRLLLGKLGHCLLMKSDFAQPRPCSCCDKPWRTRHNSQRLLQLGFSGRNSKPDIPNPRRISRRGSLKKTKDHKLTVVASDFASKINVGSGGGGGMAHVGYTELKITSDAESEFPFSDEDGFLSMNEIQIESSEKSAVDSHSEKLSINKIPDHKQDDLPENQNKHMPVKEEKIVEAPMPELSLLGDIHQETVLSDIQGDIAENGAGANENSSDPERISNINSSEATLYRDEQTADSPPTEPSCGNRNHVHDLENASGSVVNEEYDVVVEQKVSESIVPENVSGFLAKVESSKEEDGFDEDLEPSMLHKVIDSRANDGLNEDDGINGYSEPLTLHSVTGSATKEHSSEEENELNEDLETSKLCEVSGSVGIENSNEEENGSKEESEPSALHNIPNEESSKAHGNEETLKAMETQSISIETPKLKHFALVESFDVSINNEIEGENLVDLLRRQVEHDKKCLRDLQKELEEERNASSIAADETMAMITRLQEEKAALHMEASHYLRMMDEQAEYDVDALEKANDLLAEKEKEIQDLETELEYYRLKFQDDSREETIGKGNSDHKGTNIITSATDDTKLKASMDAKCTHRPSFIRSSSLGIEKEKVFISECLRNLEKKLHQFTSGRLPECAENGSPHHTKENCPLRHEDEEPIFNGESPNEEAVNYLNSKYHSVSAETDSINDKNKLIRFENEISDLKNRLETLRADREFLECSVNSLEKGKEGLQFIQEIAHQLQELRNLGIRRR